MPVAFWCAFDAAACATRSFRQIGSSFSVLAIASRAAGPSAGSLAKRSSTEGGIMKHPQASLMSTSFFRGVTPMARRIFKASQLFESSSLELVSRQAPREQ